MSTADFSTQSITLALSYNTVRFVGLKNLGPTLLCRMVARFARVIQGTSASTSSIVKNSGIFLTFLKFKIYWLVTMIAQVQNDWA